MIRPKAAARCRYIQPNTPSTLSWLVFDIDHPDGAIRWEDTFIPPPKHHRLADGRLRVGGLGLLGGSQQAEKTHQEGRDRLRPQLHAVLPAVRHWAYRWIATYGPMTSSTGFRTRASAASAPPRAAAGNPPTAGSRGVGFLRRKGLRDFPRQCHRHPRPGQVNRARGGIRRNTLR